MEWSSYAQIEPIGDDKTDYHFAKLYSLMTNLIGSVYGKKGQFKPTKPSDFMTKWDAGDVKSKPVQSMEEMKEILMSMASASKMREKAPLDRPPRSLRQKRINKK